MHVASLEPCGEVPQVEVRVLTLDGRAEGRKGAVPGLGPAPYVFDLFQRDRNLHAAAERSAQLSRRADHGKTRDLLGLDGAHQAVESTRPPANGVASEVGRWAEVA